MSDQDLSNYLDYACPSCDVQPGEPCMSMAHDVHPSRIQFAENSVEAAKFVADAVEAEALATAVVNTEQTEQAAREDAEAMLAGLRAASMESIKAMVDVESVMSSTKVMAFWGLVLAASACAYIGMSAWWWGGVLVFVSAFYLRIHWKAAQYKASLGEG